MTVLLCAVAVALVAVAVWAWISARTLRQILAVERERAARAEHQAAVELALVRAESDRRRAEDAAVAAASAIVDEAHVRNGFSWWRKGDR